MNMVINHGTTKKGIVSMLELLYLIRETNKLYGSDEDVYFYLDGKPMSSKDIGRVVYGKYLKKSKLPGDNGMGGRLTNLRNKGLIIIVPEQTYPGITGQPRNRYTLTDEGTEFLESNISKVKSNFRNIIGKFSLEEKKELMPELVKLINT